MVTINASEFKAKCLAILDEVAFTGEEVPVLSIVVLTLPQILSVVRDSS